MRRTNQPWQCREQVSCWGPNFLRWLFAVRWYCYSSSLSSDSMYMSSPGVSLSQWYLGSCLQWHAVLYLAGTSRSCAKLKWGRSKTKYKENEEDMLDDIRIVFMMPLFYGSKNRCTIFKLRKQCIFKTLTITIIFLSYSL